MVVLLNFIYLLSLVFWVGSIFFFSFAAAPSIFNVLTRELAGDVVADIFPKYYLIGYICGGLILVSLLARNFLFESAGRFLNLNLVLVILMMVFSLYAGQILRPQAAEVKKEYRSVEVSSGKYLELEKKFKFIHLKSVICNIFVFIFGIAIIVINAYNYRVY